MPRIIAVTYQSRREITNGRFASRQSRLIYQRDYRRNDWGGQRRAANPGPKTTGIDDLPITDSSDIGVCTAAMVEETTLDRREVVVDDEMVVSTERESDLVEVRVDSSLLPRRNAKHIREATARCESGGRYFVERLKSGRGVGCTSRAIQLSRADRKDVRAFAHHGGVENEAIAPRRAGRRVTHAVITR